MNLSYFISKRISRGPEGGFSTTIHGIAIVTIAIGLAASITSFMIMGGFQGTIKEKIYSFSSHILVTKYTTNNSMEEQSFSFNIDLYNHPEKYPFIDHVQEFSHKAGLIKIGDEVQGILFKGVGRSFDLKRFDENILTGRFIHFYDSGYSHEVLLSQIIAGKLKLKPGDEMIVHFFQNPPRFRKLKVVGIYETNLSDYFDNKVIIGDIRMIQQLNNTSDSTAGGLQIYLKDLSQVDEAETMIRESLNYDLGPEKVSGTYVQVFEWLSLVGRQVNILLVVILTVVCVNMISVVLILVMERTQMIGVLKALGARDSMIRRIFLYNGINLILKGLVYGNAFGLGLCYLQYKFHFVKLNAHDYYMSYVPIGWDWGMVLLLNVLVFGVVTLVLLLPTAIVARINPIKAIRFD